MHPIHFKVRNYYTTTQSEIQIKFLVWNKFGDIIL